MTIPSRPAPAPPGSRGQNAAAGANASIEQLRLQLQQQQQQFQQQHQLQQQQKLLIKLPPPPKRPGYSAVPQSTYNNPSNNNYTESLNNAITRKFPPARYTPTTSWDDSPFSGGAVGNNNNLKKVPPPRPPPPKVQSLGKKSTAPPPPAGTRPTQAGNVLSSIFQRKSKNSKTNSNTSRVYTVNSGTHGSALNISNNNSNQQNSYSTHTNPASWSTNWTTTSTGYNTNIQTNISSTTTTTTQEAQLISFDSPPSSPTFTQKSNSDCVSVDSFSSDSNFSSPQNGSVSQPESGFEDDFSGARSRPATTSPLDPWETLDVFSGDNSSAYSSTATIGTAPVRNLNTINTRIQTSNDNPLCNGKSLLPPAPSLTAPTIIKPKISQKPKAPKPPIFIKQYHGNSINAISSEDDPPTPPSPPMPQCAPPPPPVGVSLLDVISGKVDALHLTNQDNDAQYVQEPPYGVALYNFDGIEEGDLNFRENEKIYLLEQVSDEWYRGRTRAGCEGIFPGNYIEIKVPLSKSKANNESIAQNTYLYKYNEYRKQDYEKQNHHIQVRSAYNFPAEVEGDLELKENDMVTILYKINEDWLYGEVDGRQGQFPANFLEYVPDNIPMP